MSNEFEPFRNEGKQSEFSVWEYQSPENPEVPEISAEELFLNECERLKQEAFEKGYADGLQQGQAEILAQRELWTQWIEVLLKPVQLLDEQLIQEVIQTIMYLGEACIGVELSVNPEKLRTLINEIKGELPSLRGNKVFAMHPLDVDWIKTQMDEKEIPGLHQTLVADPSLNRGDFYLKDEHSELDGRLQTRFATLFAKYINKEQHLSFNEPQD